MACLTSDDLSMHYTDDGAGEVIITLHGLSESDRYWTLPSSAIAPSTGRPGRFLGEPEW